MSIRRVHAGEKLRISAHDWNTVADAASAHQLRRQGGGAGDSVPDNRADGLVLVKNASGYDRARFEILGVDSPIFGPTDNLPEFQNSFALSCVTPSISDHKGRFVILAEPIAYGKIGRAWIAGVCPVKVDMQTAADTHADVKDAEAGYLTGGESGSARILWAESGTGQKWALVRIGQTSAGDSGDIEFGKPTSTFSAGDTITLDPCDVDGTDNGEPNATVFLGCARESVTHALATGNIVTFRRFAEPTTAGVGGIVVGNVFHDYWPHAGDNGDIWYRSSTDWARLGSPSTEGDYRLECDVNGSGVPSLEWRSSAASDGGVTISAIHRICIPDGTAAGSYTFDSRDWRGRMLCCWLQTVYDDTPNDEQWGGGASTGVARYFGPTYDGADRSLTYATGGSPAIMLDADNGALYWSWDANSSGLDLHAIVMIQATDQITSADHTA